MPSNEEYCLVYNDQCGIGVEVNCKNYMSLCMSLSYLTDKRSMLMAARDGGTIPDGCGLAILR